MVKIIKGHKGSGKTKQIVDLANDTAHTTSGSVIFITNDQRLMYDLKYQIRVVSMEDFPHVTNADEFIGFIYGIISGDHDIEDIFIDNVLKHADFTVKDVPEFVERVKKIADHYEMNIIVSIGAEMEELQGVDFEGTELLN